MTNLNRISRVYLQGLAETIDCKDSLACIGSEFQSRCRARNIGLKGFVECLEPAPGHCRFLVPFGDARLCHCPVRVHAATELGL